MINKLRKATIKQLLKHPARVVKIVTIYFLTRIISNKLVAISSSWLSIVYLKPVLSFVRKCSTSCLCLLAVKEAAVQRRHNLYRDSIVLSNSDPSLHLLGENPSIDWVEKYGGQQEEGEELEEASEGDGESVESQKRRRVKQVVSMIQVEGSGELFKEELSIDVIQEETDEAEEQKGDGETTSEKSRSPVAKDTEIQPDIPSDSASKKEANPDDLSKEKNLVKVESDLEDASADVKGPKEENLQPVVKEEPCPNEVSEEMPPSSPCPEEILSEGTETTPENPSDLTNGSVLEEVQAKPEDLCKENAALINSAVDCVSVAKEEIKEVSKAAVEGEPGEGLQHPPPAEDAPSEASQTTPENPPELSNGSDLKDEEKAVDPGDQDADGALVNIKEEKKKEINQPVSKELPTREESDEAVPAQPEETRGSTPENPLLQHNDSGFQSPTSEVEEQGEVTSTPAPQASE